MFNFEELKLIRSCLYITKDVLKFSPYKKEDMKNKIKEIDNLIKKIEGC